MSENIKFEFPVTISYHKDYEIPYSNNQKEQKKIKKDICRFTKFNRESITEISELLEYANNSVISDFLYENDSREKGCVIKGTSVLCYDIDITKKLTAKQKEVYFKTLIIRLLLLEYNFAIAPSLNGGLHLYIIIKQHNKKNYTSTEDYRVAVTFAKHQVAIKLGIEKDYDKKEMLIGARIKYIKDDLFNEDDTKKNIQYSPPVPPKSLRRLILQHDTLKQSHKIY